MTAQTITLLATAHDEYGCPNPGVPAWRKAAATSFVDVWYLQVEAESRRAGDAWQKAMREGIASGRIVCWCDDRECDLYFFPDEL